MGRKKINKVADRLDGYTKSELEFRESCVSAAKYALQKLLDMEDSIPESEMTKYLSALIVADKRCSQIYKNLNTTDTDAGDTIIITTGVL